MALICDTPAQVFPEPVVLGFPHLVFSAVRFTVSTILDYKSRQGFRGNWREVVEELAQCAKTMKCEGGFGVEDRACFLMHFTADGKESSWAGVDGTLGQSLLAGYSPGMVKLTTASGSTRFKVGAICLAKPG